MSSPIPTKIVPSAKPAEMSPAQVAREFRALLDDGMQIRPAGEAKRDPESLLSRGYTPKYKLELFDTVFYLTNVRQNEDIRFYVAYVVQSKSAGGRKTAFPRIFYKDLSLIWRAASHFIRSDTENWIGKGDVRAYMENGEELYSSAESTTDLPLEIQTGLESLIRRGGRIRSDQQALALVLRRGPDDRIAPYSDFSEPRRKAQSDPRNLINRNRPVARFSRHNDPRSLRFVSGFEPDFSSKGILELSTSTSKLYGGELRRYRVLSRNRKIQYFFMAGPHQAWVVPPQATTAQLSSFGLRTVDVVADDDLFVPGYEYHYLDVTVEPPEFYSQIPKGYAGKTSELDAYRADASPWLEKLPVVREFRTKVLNA
ncbi:MAG: hypothetical protein JRG96_18590 [Deltaproteobacteria bacterium]|nr:hypothetical protein [Deltaproteobacteria bacterium]